MENPWSSSRIGSRWKWECQNSSHLIGSSVGQCFSSLPTWRVLVMLMGTVQILTNQLRISELAGKWRTMQISSRGGGKCMQINLYFLVHRSQDSLPLKLLLALKQPSSFFLKYGSRVCHPQFNEPQGDQKNQVRDSNCHIEINYFCIYLFIILYLLYLIIIFLPVL